MSTNIEVKRICEYCGKDFIAKTTVTRYCSQKCNSRHYKAKQRNKKIDISNRNTLAIKAKPLRELKEKEFLTVRDTATLLNCSRQMIYGLINSGKLNAINIREKKTLVARSTIDKLFKI